MLRKFLASPSNRAGLSAWVATVITAVAQWIIYRNAPPLDDILGIFLGVVAILQPESAVTVAQLDQAVTDLRTALADKNATNIEAVITDAKNIVTAVEYGSSPKKSTT